MKLNSKELKRLADVKSFLEQINRTLPDKISAVTLSHNSKLPFKAFSLREVLIHRVAELSETAVNLFESNKLVPAIIMTRAVFETTAVLYWLYERIKQATTTKELGDIDEFLMKSLFGGRVSEAPVESYNVLKAIDHINKKFQFYKESYGTLSEFAHPNWSGLMGAYSKLDKEEFTLHLGKQVGKVPILIALPLLAASLKLFIHYYDDMEKYLLQFNKICDEMHGK
jgi:hypothetical protein